MSFQFVWSKAPDTQERVATAQRSIHRSDRRNFRELHAKREELARLRKRGESALRAGRRGDAQRIAADMRVLSGQIRQLEGRHRTLASMDTELGGIRSMTQMGEAMEASADAMIDSGIADPQLPMEFMRERDRFRTNSEMITEAMEEVAEDESNEEGGDDWLAIMEENVGQAATAAAPPVPTSFPRSGGGGASAQTPVNSPVEDGYMDDLQARLDKIKK